MHEVHHFIRKQVRKRPPVCAGAVKQNRHPCCRLSRYSVAFRASDHRVYRRAVCGGVLGLARTLRSLSLRDGQRLVIVTVGLADPDIPQNRENIRNSLQKQIPAQLYGRAAVFHLRGAIDYQALSLGHRTMMALLHRSLQKKPAEEWSEEDKALMETYGKQADFVDFASLRRLSMRCRGKAGKKNYLNA